MSTVDDSWYRAVMRFAAETPWLHGAAMLFTGYGILLYVVLGAIAWRRGRHSGARVMFAAVWVPVAGALGYLANVLLKMVFTEPRPCQVLRIPTVAPCDPPGDYSFPSSHAAVAAALTAALLIVHRRLGLVAAVLALLLAVSRVYTGAHYPHDVVAGLVVGALAGAIGLIVRPLGTKYVERLRDTRLRPLLALAGAPPREAHSVRH